jgi:hypothetical protein
MTPDALIHDFSITWSPNSAEKRETATQERKERLKFVRCPDTGSFPGPVWL